MYGALQGFNKSETAAQYGEAQVKVMGKEYLTVITRPQHHINAVVGQYGAKVSTFQKHI